MPGLWEASDGEDSAAEVDANFVMAGDGRWIEMQCTAEGSPFQPELLARMQALAAQGIDLVDVYLGPGGVFTGAARLQQEAREKAAALATQEELEHRRRILDRKRQIMEAQVAALQAEISAEEEELQAVADQSKLQEKIAADERERLAAARKADAPESK